MRPRILLTLSIFAFVSCRNNASVQILQEQTCAAQAKAEVETSVVKNEGVKGTVVDLKSHFDPQHNECLVRVEYHSTLLNGPSWMRSIAVFSIDDNRATKDYGDYVEIHNEQSFLPKGVEIGVCKVGGKKCSNEGEFNELIRPYPIPR